MSSSINISIDVAIINPFTPGSDQKNNFSLQYHYSVKQTGDEKKNQLEDNCLI